MSEHNMQQVSDSFDHDFGQSNNHLVVPDHHNVHTNHQDVTSLSLSDHHGLGTYDSSNDFLDYQDPLKHAYKHQFQPLTLDNTHFVNPHHVNGYFRNDGTYVNGYFRDGDGNTAIDHPAELGGGYISSNPDGNPFNNLK
ncbi:hypothetical protein COE51_23755 [Bacillus pseudomycoides]|nr:hypothetical protein COE51_23755 [Bacillus pseudomycoides]